MNNLPSLSDLNLELARRSYREFISAAWNIADPGSKLLPNWHVDVLADHLQAVSDRKIKKLNINMPFRLGKTNICSVLWPAFCWIHNPELKFIVVSYSLQLSSMISLRIRNLVTSEFYNRIAPHVKLSDAQGTKSFFINSQGGHILSATTGSSVTGFTANILVLDDPLSSSTANSQTERESSTLNIFDGFFTRLTPPSEGRIVCVSQRLHSDDLSGLLLKNPEFDRLILPMVFEGTQRSRTALNWQDPREEGQLIFPEYFTQEAVDSFKLGLSGQGGGSQFYSSQLQQNPTPGEGNLFLRDHFKWYDPSASPKFKRVILSFDTAFKTGKDNDWSVGISVGEAEDGFYLIDLVKAKVPYYALKEMIISFYNKHERVYAVIIEDKASGQSIIQDLRAQTRIPILPAVLGVNMERDKVGRAQLTSAHAHAGNVYLPRNTNWTHDFLEEVCSFPLARHDDQVDAFTQSINYLLSTRSRAGITII